MFKFALIATTLAMVVIADSSTAFAQKSAKACFEACSKQCEMANRRSMCLTTCQASCQSGNGSGYRK